LFVSVWFYSVLREYKLSLIVHFKHRIEKVKKKHITYQVKTEFILT